MLLMGAVNAQAQEAYATLTGSNNSKTLTFYYDNNRGNYSTTYSLNTESNDPEWLNIAPTVKDVVFAPSFADTRPTSCYEWFYTMQYLTSITSIENLNTEEVTNMAYMFYGCSKLSSIDVSNFNTANVTDMGVMFCNCSQLSSLDLSNFNTENVTLMDGMFSGCSMLSSVDLSSFNTEKVTNMDVMFYNCYSLIKLDLSNFIFGNNTTTSLMLYYCQGLWVLTIPNSAKNFDSDACKGVGDMYEP